MTKKKRFYETYASLILAVILLMSTAMALQAAYPGVGTPYGTVPVYPAHPAELLPVVGNIPEWGYYGGYWAMWDRIMPSLATNLGFSSATTGNYYQMSDDWRYWDQIWDDPGWQHSTQNIRVGDDPPACWDLTAFEWWTLPTGMLWNDAIILSETVPPDGYNVWPYINEVADELYWNYMEASVAADRKHWIDLWQKELMRNPVMANVYFPTIWELYSSYINNFYGTVWWYDVDNLAIDEVELNATRDAGKISPIEWSRVFGGTVKWGITEDWWNYNPAMCSTYTEETMANLITGTLYAMSLDPWPAQGTIPYPGDYYSKPDLASGPPVITNGGLTATIPLKTDIWWSDGEKFDAEDVVYTFNLNLRPPAKATALGDFAPIVSAVNVGANPYEVVLTLHRPYNDLECILSNSWGLSILPEHYYSSIPVSALRDHVSNWDWTVHKNAPVLGPFKLDEATVSYLKYVKHPGWWGNSTAGYGYTIQDTINTIILDKVEDASTRLLKLQTHELDFAEYPTAPAATMKALRGTPGLTVFERPYLGSNGVWFNINNPYLSNRYLRLAICYAIPYGDIWINVLPSWGVQTVITGGNLVHPWQYIDGTQLMNTVMPPYTYNPAWANAYLDMWKNSRILHAPNAAVGPVGDADFSGLVELDDYKLWSENFGLTEEAHDFLPGNDEDADFNNDNIVDGDDFTLWASKFGYYYPNGSTTKTYPY